MEFEIERQGELLRRNEPVNQQTMGWDEKSEITLPQRTKEQEQDYRYFPEPDLPPLVVDQDWIAEMRASMPELPAAKFQRFRQQYQLSEYDANVLISNPEVADYFEAVVTNTPKVEPALAANWITGELFGLLNQAGEDFSNLKVSPNSLFGLLTMLAGEEINNQTAKSVLEQMFNSGKSAQEIVDAKGLRQSPTAGRSKRRSGRF